MLKRWRFYLQLGWLDLVRLWPTTRHHSIIVAGICLPILMLLGIKRGHVTELRRDLLTSPLGRQVTFWSARKGELMDRGAIERLRQELPNVELIIPETQRFVRLCRVVDSDVVESDHIAREFLPATIYATRSGDPQLTQLGLAAPSANEPELIVSERIAQLLQVSVGETIELWLSRGRDANEEEVSLQCKIIAVTPTEQQNALVGFMDLDFLDAFEEYVRGQRVERLNWSSASNPARDCYASYVVFCERSNDLNDEDRRFFSERGLMIEDCTENPPSPLAQLLVADFRERLKIYMTTTTQLSEHPEPRLQFAPSELSEQTQADDVVVPWNEPAIIVADGQVWLLAGISLPRRTWLREYFIRPEQPFDYDAIPFQARTDVFTDQRKLGCHLRNTVQLDLSCETLTENPSTLGGREADRDTAESPSDASVTASNSTENDKNPSGDRVAVIPANLAAWLAAYRANLVEFDASIPLFVPRPSPPVYDRARLYTQTIDDVPTVVKSLAKMNFAVMSETGRIAEIHRQDGSLQILVWVVGTGVFLFGIVTIISVLLDSTDRKRGAIGILRVMGMSPAGVFASILLRSAMIGLLAAILSLACGWGLAFVLEWSPSDRITWLSWKPVVHIELNPGDLAIVTMGALVCCSLGAIPPAWRASRLDPFDAIVEGRFR